MSIVLRQTGAMFVDAYRELSAGKLFWITLALSTLVALIFAAVGINEDGMSIAGVDLPFPITSEQLPPETLYKFLFFQFGLSIWLAWVATILALITTAGIIPSLVSSGVIDSMVAKPISRTRLFLTRFSTGMIFAALQVTLFTTVAFLVLGIRGDTWIWSAFLAIPIVIIFYSYLFSIMTLVGLLTRSTIPSLLVTLLAWFFLFIVNVVDSEIIEAHENAKLGIAAVEQRLDLAEQNANRLYISQKHTEGETLPDDYQATKEQLHSVNVFLPLLENSLQNQRNSENMLRPWAKGLFMAKTVLPKTGETIGLLNRYVMSEEDATAILDFIPDEISTTTVNEESGAVTIGARDSIVAISEKIESRSLFWVLGTSLMFDGVILGICCFIFARRDF